MKKVFIVGGHPGPALAVVEELSERKDFEVYYVGERVVSGKTGVSYERTAAIFRGVRFIPFKSGKIGLGLMGVIGGVVEMPGAILRAVGLMRKYRPDVVLAFGGFLSTPFVIGAWCLGILRLIHDQTLVVDRANRINQWFCSKVMIGFSEVRGKFREGVEVVVTGNPLRRSLFSGKGPSWLGKVKLKKYPVVFVTGGSSGSLKLNKMVWSVLPRLLEKYVVVHQTGVMNFSQVGGVLAGLRGGLAERYFPVAEVLPEEIGEIYRVASVVVGRSGANTVTELVAFRKPAVLVPLRIAHHGEQEMNARWLAKFGLAEVVSEDDGGEDLLAGIEKGVAGELKLKVDKEEMGIVGDGRGAWRIVNIMEEMVK